VSVAFINNRNIPPVAQRAQAQPAVQPVAQPVVQAPVPMTLAGMMTAYGDLFVVPQNDPAVNLAVNNFSQAIIEFALDEVDNATVPMQVYSNFLAAVDSELEVMRQRRDEGDLSPNDYGLATEEQLDSYTAALQEIERRLSDQYRDLQLIANNQFDQPAAQLPAPVPAQPLVQELPPGLDAGQMLRQFDDIFQDFPVAGPWFDVVMASLEMAAEDGLTSTRDILSSIMGGVENTLSLMDRRDVRPADFNLSGPAFAAFRDQLNTAAERIMARIGQEAAPVPAAIAQQGDPMPNMDTSELLIEYRDRLTTDQAQWLEDFDDRWNGQEGNTDEGRQGLVDDYERWRNANRLLPVAQAPVPAIAADYTQMPMTDLMSQITQMDNDTGGVWRRVNENTEFALRIARRQGADPATVGQAISQGAFVDPDTTSIEREYIARVIAQNLRDDAEYAARNQQPALLPARLLTTVVPELATRVLQDYEGDSNGLRNVVNALQRGVPTFQTITDLPENQQQIAMAALATALEERLNQPAPDLTTRAVDFYGILDDVGNRVGAGGNDADANRVDVIAQRLTMTINPRLDPTGYVALVRREIENFRANNESEAVIAGLRMLADDIENAAAAEDQLVQYGINDTFSAQELRQYASSMADPFSQAWRHIDEQVRQQAVNSMLRRALALDAETRDRGGFDVRATAQYLFDTELDDTGFYQNYRVPALLDTIDSLRNGQIDHPSFQEINDLDRRNDAMSETAQIIEDRLEKYVLEDMLQPIPPRNGMRDAHTQKLGFNPVTANLRNAEMLDLYALVQPEGFDIVEERVRAIQGVNDNFSNPLGPTSKMVADMIRNYPNMDYAEGLSDAQREILYRKLSNPNGENILPRGFANGGIVQQNPTTDQMQYALMMRRI
jgi:hypothetical protein